MEEKRRLFCKTFIESYTKRILDHLDLSQEDTCQIGEIVETMNKIVKPVEKMEMDKIGTLIIGGIEISFNLFNTLDETTKRKEKSEFARALDYVFNDEFHLMDKDKKQCYLEILFHEVALQLSYVYEYQLSELKATSRGVVKFANWCVDRSIYFIRCCHLNKIGFIHSDAYYWVSSVVYSYRECEFSHIKGLQHYKKPQIKPCFEGSLSTDQGVINKWDKSLFKKTKNCYQSLDLNLDLNLEERFTYRIPYSQNKGLNRGNGYRYGIYQLNKKEEEYESKDVIKKFEEIVTSEESEELEFKIHVRDYYINKKPYHLDYLESGGLLNKFLNSDKKTQPFNQFLSEYFLGDGHVAVVVFRFTDFRQFDLRGANFAGSVFFDANFQDAKLEGVCFDGAVLIRSDFKGARLGDTSFQKAILYQANFENVEFSEKRKKINFDGANLDFSKMGNTKWPKEVNFENTSVRFYEGNPDFSLVQIEHTVFHTTKQTEIKKNISNNPSSLFKPLLKINLIESLKEVLGKIVEDSCTFKVSREDKVLKIIFTCASEDEKKFSERLDLLREELKNLLLQKFNDQGLITKSFKNEQDEHELVLNCKDCKDNTTINSVSQLLWCITENYCSNQKSYNCNLL